MEKIIFQKNHEKIFHEHGLTKFRDIYYYSGITPIGKNQRRSVCSFIFKDNGIEKTYFMKLFKIPYLSDMFFAMRNCGKLASQAELEFNNAQTLFDIGVQTYRPVCYGEHRVAGIELRSFIITEKIDGCPMTEYAANNWHIIEQDKKNEILTAIGMLVRKIHNADISFKDLYLWHIFISEPNYNLAVIDLGRMKMNCKSLGQKLENLGRLHHSMIDKYFDENMRLEVIKAYVQDDMDIDEIYQKVKKYSLKISRRRKPQRY